ncbi:hypothetical protein DSOUD_1148 [Desulfuromonas soudanensis]|uniref:DUF4124 domain-containing protein n=1 Tax=Desulfuromonas soudanensis TaxID=1603606 RepID=A0A0M4D8C3_9BACT|nr:hypothetical protein [Desulfuromonas soudanensis]ALC15930.1 hypothetical protein DSOUD_1148 [Desulfuromonas soudanensis]
MIRIATLLLLLLFWCGSAFAVVYQCRTRENNLFLTNNRNKFPPGCVQVGEPIGEAPAPSPPDSGPPALQRREPETIDPRRASPPPRSRAPLEVPEETTPEGALHEGSAPGVSPETGPEAARPESPDEQPPLQEGQAEEGTDEGADPPGQPEETPDTEGPAAGGEVPAAEAGAAGEGEGER